MTTRLDGEDKISTITGIIVVCDSQECERDLWDTYINEYPKLRFLDRQHIKAVIDEHKLNLSGMTEAEQSIKAGKFINASHLLLHRKKDQALKPVIPYLPKPIASYPTRLLNINTLEVEFTFEPMKSSFPEYSMMTQAAASFMGRGFYPFLNALNRHALNTDKKAIYVAYDDYQAIKFTENDKGQIVGMLKITKKSP